MYQNNLSKGSLRQALLLGAASVVALGISVPASAQESTVETVVVTGSRIPQQGLYSSSPVTAIGQQEMKFEGTTNVESLLNNLPSVSADMTSMASNGATGTASVDLRGLGSERTLVLVDGKRLMPGDPSDPVPDLNDIPAALVDHVEVLTGGASAVYGSDAEAGVVNFIMRKDFEGVEVDGQYTINNASNSNGNDIALQNAASFATAPKDWMGGASDDATLLLGTNTDNGKGNITAYVSYRNVEPVLESKRDFSACSISTNGADTHVCAGSSNYNRWISLDDYYGGANYDFFETGTGAQGSGAFAPYHGGPSEKFNYGALNYLQRPDTRYTAGYFAHYAVNPAFNVYSSFMFADDHTLAQIAPSGAFLGNYENVNCDNPLMTAQENEQLCGLAGSGTYATGPETGRYDGSGNVVPGQALVGIGRRDFEGGDRIDDLRHTSYRMVVGIKGDLGGGWNYDVYGQYGLSLFTETYENEWSKARVQNALEVDPVTGDCYSAEPNAQGYVTAADCVPLNIFNGFNSSSGGALTPAALNYVKAQGFKEGFTEEQILSGSLTGDLGEWGIQSPWAGSPVALALGAEYRSESLELQVDQEFSTGDMFGQGGATLAVPKSGFNVKEVFGEVDVPLVENKQFFESLNLSGAYRYSSYNTAGSVASYKYGADWQPIDDVRFRGSFQRAVRAPTVLELYSPGNVGLYGGTDPCSSPANATVTANCIAHGVPNPGSGILTCPASQCDAQFGGNVDVKPETSDTRTFGLVFTPTFIDGFSATVDYFSIRIDGALGGVNPNVITAACYGASSTAASQAFACPLIIRDPATHSIHSTVGYVEDQVINSGFLSTKGVDFEANYTADLDDWGLNGAGSLSFNLLGTLTNSLTTEPIVGFEHFNCAGLYGVVCGTPTPHWRHKLRVTWSSPWDVDLSLDWRHFGSVGLDLNTANPLLNGSCGTSGYPCPDLVDGKIPTYDYFDLSANWTVSDGVSLRAGVNNMFDKDPPVVDSNNYGISAPAFGNGNTFPGVYDSLGRTIYVGATIKY